jgi:hypothetical protein
MTTKTHQFINALLIMTRLNAAVTEVISAESVISYENIIASTSNIIDAKEPQSKPTRNNILASGQPIIATIDSEKRPNRGWVWETNLEPENTGWALYIDNDLFAL